MNRYTSLTPSQFNPLSLEEIMLVPAMQRKKHDDLLVKQEEIRSGLAKVNPLDVHYDEAMRLKQGIEAELDATAKSLAEKGIDPNTSSKVIALNRKYNDLVAPTGRIGQINTAYQVEAAEKKKFFENPAFKEYGVDALEKAWQKHRSKENYSGYDDKGNIINIGMLSAPKYEDMQKDFMELSSRLGEETKTYLNNIGAHFQPGPFGGLIMVSADGKTINTSNDKNLDALAKTMEAKYLKETGEGYKSREFSGYDKQNTLDQLNSMLNIPRVNKNIKDLNYSYQNISAPSGNGTEENNTTPTGIFDPTSQKEVTRENILKVDFSNIGKEYSAPFGIKALGITRNSTDSYKGNMSKGRHTYKDIIKDPLMQTAYKNTFETLINSGKLPKNSKIDDNKTALVIEKEFKNGNVKIPTIGNDIIMADITPNSQMFMGELANKDEKSRNALMQNQLDAGLRSMIDPKTGEELTPEKFREKGYKIEYIGYDSPINYRGYNFKGGNQNVQTTMAHKVNVYDEDGKSLGQSAVTRTAQEIKDSKFQKSYQMTHIYRNAVNNFNNWVTPSSVKNTKVKFKDNGLFDIQYNGQLYEDLDNAQYQIFLDEIMTNQSK